MSGSILFMPIRTLPNLIEKAASTSIHSKLSNEERVYLHKVVEILKRCKIETKTQLTKRLGAI